MRASRARWRSALSRARSRWTSTRFSTYAAAAALLRRLAVDSGDAEVDEEVVEVEDLLAVLVLELVHFRQAVFVTVDRRVLNVVRDACQNYARAGSAAPIVGATDECEVEFDFSNTVERVLEDPRVTKPYSEEQWQEILALGKAVDREFEANDVRLTMGGEPTFVSIDDMESPQWNNAALGADKRRLAGELLQRLKAKLAPVLRGVTVRDQLS